MREGIKPIPYLPLLPFIVITSILVILSKDNIFFWDTVQLGSKQAHWFFENNFRNILLPDSIDSGHPPLFGIYLAFLWKCFGKSLLVSHLAMVPFLFGILFQCYHLGSYFLGKKFAWIFPLILMVNPAYLGHSILISPDIPLMFFFLLALYSLLKNRQSLKVIALLGLSLISMRGMALVFCLFVFEIIISIRPSVLKRFKDILPKYLLTVIPALLFLLYHYMSKSWIGFSSGSPWAPNFEWVEFKDVIRNIIVLGWKLSDFGNIFLLISIVVLYLWYKKTSRYLHHGVGLLINLTIIIIIVFGFITLPFKSLINPRYFLPIFTLFGFITACLFIPLFKERKGAKVLFSIMLCGLFLGNFWLYPKHISQGWDSTLAHAPYYQLRNEMMNYIISEKIELNTIGTEFPNRGPLKFMDLSNNTSGMEESDFNTHEYILYSTIMNDFSDNELQELEQNWAVVKKMKRANIEMILYERK